MLQGYPSVHRQLGQKTCTGCAVKPLSAVTLDKHLPPSSLMSPKFKHDFGVTVEQQKKSLQNGKKQLQSIAQFSKALLL